MKEALAIPYETYSSPESLPTSDRELADKAREAAGNSYAPYSGYRVGAAARLESGRIITAANQESQAFPSGLCAERILLYSHMAHSPEDRITAMAIASVPGERECRPCGGCRQVMADVSRRQGLSYRVIMAGDRSATVVNGPEALLPFPFEF